MPHTYSRHPISGARSPPRLPSARPPRVRSRSARLGRSQRSISPRFSDEDRSACHMKRLPVEHRVLPAPEVGEPASMKRPSARRGLAVGRRPQRADRPRRTASRRIGSRSRRTCLVDLVLARLVRRGRSSRSPGAAAGSPDRSSSARPRARLAVHEQVEAPALLAVEVLHHQPLAPLRPRAEVVRMGEEQRCRRTSSTRSMLAPAAAALRSTGSAGARVSGRARGCCLRSPAPRLFART